MLSAVSYIVNSKEGDRILFNKITSVPALVVEDPHRYCHSVIKFNLKIKDLILYPDTIGNSLYIMRIKFIQISTENKVTMINTAP